MWILLVMIFLMPFEANPHLLISDSFLGLFPRFTAIKLVGLIGLAWSVFSALASGARVGLLDSKQVKVFLVFLGIVASVSIVNGAALMTVTRLLAIVCLLPLVLIAVRTEADLWRTLKACVLVMILVFPYAYRQMLRFGGRLGVGLYETNYLALILVLLIPLAFVFFRQERVAWKRSLWLAGMGVLLLELVLTASRGGFIALLVGGGLLCLRLLKRPVLALSGMSCLLFVLLVVVPNPLAERLLASGSSLGAADGGVAASNRERVATIRAGMRMIRAHPLTGVGLGKFKDNFEAYGEERPHIAHNTYVELGAELGLPALAAFLLLAYVTDRSLRRSQRLARAARNVRLRDLAIGLQAGLAAFLVGAVFLSAQYEKFFWLVLFLSIRMEWLARRQAVARPQPILEQRELAWTA